MFGYVIPDKPNMFMKDFSLYRAYYCGLCKCIGHVCGETMRFLTNYDITFLSLLVHGVLGEEVEIKNEGCILGPLKKKPIAKYTSLMERIVDVNTILAHYKCIDDIEDNKSLSKKMLDGTIVKRHFKRAARREPEIAKIMEENFSLQRKLEHDGETSIDKVAHPFAYILKETTRILTGDKYTENIGDMMYHIGRLVYFMDAIDDAEDDAKKKEYNPMLIDYEFTTLEKFKEDKGEMLRFLLMSSYNTVKKNYESVVLKTNEGPITNIIWYGIPERIEDILGRTCKCKKIRI